MKLELQYQEDDNSVTLAQLDDDGNKVAGITVDSGVKVDVKEDGRVTLQDALYDEYEMELPLEVCIVGMKLVSAFVQHMIGGERVSQAVSAANATVDSKCPF